MLTLLMFLYVLAAVVMIVSILMQSGRGTGLSGAFGSSWESGMIFGGRGATTILTKITTISAIVFVLLTILVNLYIARPHSAVPTRSVVKERAVPVAPVEPGEEERLPQKTQPSQQGQ